MRRVVLRKQHVRAITRGHPWVYRQAVAGKLRGVSDGDPVEVVTENGGFVGRGLAAPSESTVVRMLTREQGEALDDALFARRIEAANDLRTRARVPDVTDAYRLVNAEGDRVPGLLADRHGDWVTLTLQTAALRSWTRALVAGVRGVTDAKGIYVRDERGCRLAEGAAAPERVVVHEPTIRALAMPAAATKSGIFSDMRDVRIALAPLTTGRRVLNLFAHTGAFSAAAARAGAARVVSVDMSGPYLGLARENVELSAPGYERHETVKADVFDWLRKRRTDDERYDVVIVDPPTFSGSRSSGAFNVRDRYRPLVRAALRALADDGVLVCATNFRRLGREDFLHMLHDAFDAERSDVRVLRVMGQAADHPVVPAFPEGAHLHVAICTRVGAS